MSTNKSIFKSAVFIGLATLCSRVLGFCRDLVIARIFGVYLYAQAFVVAFKIPNLFRDFVAEGATNSALVPVFSQYNQRQSKEEFWELANVVLNLLLVIVSAIVLLGVVLAPLVIRLVAPGFANDPAKFEATVRLTRLVFPYLLLVSLSAYCMGILNSLKDFVVSAFAPCFLNIAIIICAMLWGEGIKGLAFGVLLGGALQLLVQIPKLRSKGMRLKLLRRFRHPAASEIWVLMAPRLLSSGIYQVNNFVDTMFASLGFIVGDAAVAVLYFSYRLVQFPLGIFSTALSQALLPTLSAQALEQDDYLQLKDTFCWGLRMTFFMLVPATVGLLTLSGPIVSFLFEGGRFDSQASRLTAQALFFYSLGLSAFGATKILQSCFFALKDTATPAKAAFLGLIVNIILNALLMFPLKAAGLALATSLSGIFTFSALFMWLKKKLPGFKSDEIVRSFLRILISAVLMGLVCVGAAALLPCTDSYLLRLASLFFLLCAAVLSYILFCFLLRVREIREIRRWASQRLWQRQ